MCLHLCLVANTDLLKTTGMFSVDVFCLIKLSSQNQILIARNLLTVKQYTFDDCVQDKYNLHYQSV